MSLRLGSGREIGRELIRYPTDELWSELTYLAYHLHWELDDVLALEHGDRGRLIDEVATLNKRSWEEVTQLD